jgi:hypothetical protein
MTSSVRHGFLGLGLLCLAAVAGGCNKSEAAQTKPTKATGESATPLSSKAEKDNFIAYLRPVGEYKKDTQGTVELVLETKGEFHTNEQYPYKFVPKPSEGVTYAKEKYGRDDGTFEATKAVIKVTFTPTQAGKVQVGGKFSLSVCSDKNCLMEKVDLDLDVEAK